MPRKQLLAPLPPPLLLPSRGRDVEVTEDVLAYIRAGAAVAIGVSGGKDSCAVAFATVQVLETLGHRGPRVLVHADLGEIEWEDSLPMCRRLAAALGMELLVVARRAGGLVSRWEKRWTDNARRYAELECVKLILPFSTAALRFCTSELKVAVISSALATRFRGLPILSVSGIRRDESRDRARAPVAAVQKRLVKPRFGTVGLDWHPIGGWTVVDVLSFLEEMEFPLHPAYTVHGCSRVSCTFCILSARADLQAATRVPRNQAVYRRLVALECRSTFGFREDLWLSDLAPDLLDSEARAAVARAKTAAAVRCAAERRIPPHLLYVKGWPVAVPTWGRRSC
jgi:3'-phosphoadenosine 5'-phosphosulfate sulfotransferase (PAPS reductase)/FAD synthetase